MSPDYLAHWTIYEIGTLDQVSFETQLPSQINNEVTLSFWFCATQSKTKQIIVSVARLFQIYLENNNFVVEMFPNNHLPVFLTIKQPSLGEWHHIVVTISQTVKLYIDNDLIQTQVIDSVFQIPHESMLHIGGYTDPAGGHFDYTFGRNKTGWVDDVRWYNQALTAKHVAELQPQKTSVPIISLEAKHLPNGTVEFVAISNQPDEIHIALWDFGDGSSGIGSSTSHQYAYSGAYQCRLTVATTSYQQIFCNRLIRVMGISKPLEKTPVFINDTEGYACYRIPSIVCAINGDLIAFAEARLEDCSDSTNIIRLVCKRSQDNGKTWSPLQIVARNLIDGHEFAVQQNAPVVDKVHSTGRIIVLYNKLEQSEFELVEGNGISRIFCIFSDDNGKTWHSEKDISTQVHRLSQWRVQRPTLGHAIQLQNGRLLFAGMMTDGDRSIFESQNYVFWSDDLGDTWVMGDVIPHIGLNEATAVELENGEIMINSRAYQDEQPIGKRAITIGRFIDGKTITFDNTYFDEALIDPTIQASLIRYTMSDQKDYGKKSRLLFSNPNHPHARYNLTIQLSYDEGKTWAISKTIEVGPSAYSDLVIQNDMDIGVLYERGNHGGIIYTNFSLDWLTGGQEILEE